MKYDIRSNVKDNIKEDNEESIIEMIDESINQEDEISLPGLGVLFEIIWNHSDIDLKQRLAGIIKENLDN